MMETPQTLNDELLNSFQSGWKPPFSGSIDKWAERYLDLQSGYNIKGKFSCADSPHFLKVFQTLKDPYVREVNILAPPRSGKTLMAEISLLHTIANSSGDVLWLTVTDEKAVKQNEGRLTPLILTCEPVHALLSDDKYRIQKQKLKFLHTTVDITSPKESTLLSTGYKFIYFDEVWKFQGSIAEVKRRSDDYLGVHKHVFFSSGGIKDSEWYKQFKSGEQWEYGFRCPHCNELQTFEFTKKRNDGSMSGIRWPETCRDKLGEWIIEDCARQSYLECFHCKHHIADTTTNRELLLQNGDWIKVGGDNEKVKSFRFTNLCNVKMSFEELTRRFLSAERVNAYLGDKTDKINFIQQDCADFWDNTINKTRVEIRLTSYDTSNPYGNDEQFRFMGVDCMDGPKLYYVIRACNRNGESRLVSFGKCNSWEEIDAVRQRNKVDYRFVFVDTGDGDELETNLSACVKYGRWAIIEGEEMWACYNSLKGCGLTGFRHADNKWYRYNEIKEYPVAANTPEDEGKYVPHVTWSNLRYKQILEHLRDGKGKKWEAADVTEEYTQHLNSEYITRKLKGNTVEVEYVKKPNTPNHWWDCELEILVAMDLFGILDATEIKQEEIKPTVST